MDYIIPIDKWMCRLLPEIFRKTLFGSCKRRKHVDENIVSLSGGNAYDIKENTIKQLGFCGVTNEAAVHGKVSFLILMSGFLGGIKIFDVYGDLSSQIISDYVCICDYCKGESIFRATKYKSKTHFQARIKPPKDAVDLGFIWNFLPIILIIDRKCEKCGHSLEFGAALCDIPYEEFVFSTIASALEYYFKESYGLDIIKEINYEKKTFCLGKAKPRTKT